MSAHPIVSGLLYRVRGYGVDRIVHALNAAHAIEIVCEGLTCAN